MWRNLRESILFNLNLNCFILNTRIHAIRKIQKNRIFFNFKTFFSFNYKLQSHSSQWFWAHLPLLIGKFIRKQNPLSPFCDWSNKKKVARNNKKAGKSLTYRHFRIRKLVEGHNGKYFSLIPDSDIIGFVVHITCH